jgi:hypothetical protein
MNPSAGSGAPPETGGVEPSLSNWVKASGDAGSVEAITSPRAARALLATARRLAA